MGTNVNSMKIEDFTDRSGKFHVGMTREEAAELKSSVFTFNYPSEFRRMDVDENGVLDANEVLDEIERDIKNSKKQVRIEGSLGIINALAFVAFRKTNPTWLKAWVGAAATLGVVDAVYNFVQSIRLQKRADKLSELIKQQESEKAAA